MTFIWYQSWEKKTFKNKSNELKLYWIHRKCKSNTLRRVVDSQRECGQIKVCCTKLALQMFPKSTNVNQLIFPYVLEPPQINASSKSHGIAFTDTHLRLSQILSLGTVDRDSWRHQIPNVVVIFFLPKRRRFFSFFSFSVLFSALFLCMFSVFLCSCFHPLELIPKLLLVLWL